MLYSILIHVDEDAVAALTPEEDADHVRRHMLVHDQLAAKGKLGPCVRLMPTSTAKQLRTAAKPGDKALIVDGPFAETKEQFLGFYIVDCESEAEAIEIASSLPSLGTIFEVRPVKLYFPSRGV